MEISESTKMEKSRAPEKRKFEAVSAVAYNYSKRMEKLKPIKATKNPRKIAKIAEKPVQRVEKLPDLSAETSTAAFAIVEDHDQDEAEFFQQNHEEKAPEDHKTMEHDPLNWLYFENMNKWDEMVEVDEIRVYPIGDNFAENAVNFDEAHSQVVETTEIVDEHCPPGGMAYFYFSNSPSDVIRTCQRFWNGGVANRLKSTPDKTTWTSSPTRMSTNKGIPVVIFRNGSFKPFSECSDGSFTARCTHTDRASGLLYCRGQITINPRTGYCRTLTNCQHPSTRDDVAIAFITRDAHISTLKGLPTQQAYENAEQLAKKMGVLGKLPSRRQFRRQVNNNSKEDQNQ